MLAGRFVLGILLPLVSLVPPPLPDSSSPRGGVSIEEVAFSPIRWGRNTVLLRGGNPGPEGTTLSVRIRSRFTDSGSGVWWEAVFPALLPPGTEGGLSFDYIVRPDHGRLRVELQVEDASGGLLHEEVRETEFEPPYREEYLLQPYRVTSEGIDWESRIFPAFEVRESEHLFFYFFPGSTAESDIEKIIRERERLLRRLGRKLDLAPPPKSIFFFYPDAEISRLLTGHRGDGWTYGRTIVEVYGEHRKIDPRHEIAHLLASTLGSPPALFAEGLATYLEEHFDNAGKYRASVESWCRGFLAEGALIPLSELMVESSLGEDLTRPRIAYPQSACFAKYLMETYGWPAYRKAYARLTIGGDPATQASNRAGFEEVYGVDLESAEANWQKWLTRKTKRYRIPGELLRLLIREETVPYLVAKGQGLLKAGDVEQAFVQLSSALRMDPEDLQAHFWMAQTHHLRKDYEEALDEYHRVIELGDRASLREMAWSRVWSGQILDLLGRREEALEQYRLGEGLRDTSQVRVGGQLISSLEAARRGLIRPYQEPKP